MISNNIQPFLRQNQAAKEGSALKMDYINHHAPRFSDKTYNLAAQIADQYADRDDNVVYLYDIPDEELLELASSIMAHDISFASEALGPDNDSFDKTILPALIMYLQRPADRDLEVEYLNKLKSGLLSYYGETMEELINDAYREQR